MLNEKEIDKLIQPLINTQVKLESQVIDIIANRLKELGTILPSDVYSLTRLFKTGSDARRINKLLSKASNLSVKQIKSIIKEVAQDAYEAAKPFYDYRHKSFISFEDNFVLRDTIKAIERVTLGEYVRLSNTSAFMLRDITNPLILRPTPVSQVYNKVIDEGIQSVVSGISTYDKVIKDTIANLTNSGITAVDYTTESGKPHRVRLDSAVRGHILNGVRNVQQEVDRVTGEQFGADGIELSVHQYSAPDHEPVQGHQFTLEEFDNMQNGKSCVDVNNNLFYGFERPIGMWNCRHIAMHIIIGHKTPNYTDKQLEMIKKKNANGITIKDKDGNDVTKSKYWCTQKRNDYELKLRKLKEAQKAAETAQQPDLADKYTSKIKQMQDKYIQFCKSAGIETRFENTRIFV